MTLINVWHLIGGISIFDLNNGRFLFRLYHKVDVDHIEVDGPWNFNSHLLVTHRLKYEDDPKTMLFFNIDFLVLIHYLLHGFMFEIVAKYMGIFIGCS